MLTDDLYAHAETRSNQAALIHVMDSARHVGVYDISLASQ
jgi:hypothetical protein